MRDLWLMGRSKPSVVVDPRLRLPYFTYVLQGFTDLGMTVRFGALDAPKGNGMAALVSDRRIWVDTDDMPHIDPAAYAWSDVFGKVNVVEEDVPTHKKLHTMGPVFGTTLWPLPGGYLQSRHFLRPGVEFRRALAGLRFQAIARLPLSAYQPGRSEPDYVFHRSRAWAGRHADTNAPRERFIAALRSTEVQHDVDLTDERISLGAYLERTKRSALVFNCPAVHGCLGWKLGEYLALGKAIVSTPLHRVLPEPLEHGVNVHFVDDEVGAMRDAILRITKDDGYRGRLETAARAWYERNLTPARVAHHLLAD